MEAAMDVIHLGYWYPLDGDFEETYSDFAELRHRMEELREKYTARIGMTFSVDLMKDNGKLREDPSTAERLSVGMGNGEWIVFYFPGQVGDRPELISLGDGAAEGTVDFFFGDSTELSRKYLVPRAKAWEVIRAWCEHGVLSDAIEWMEELY
jgi:hypothetical protein